MQRSDTNENPFARVLVIDDDPAITQTLARVLSAPDVQVDVANDALAGLALVRQHCPQLAIVDLHMPEMDGFQFIDACRSIPECTDLPILLATGDAELRSVRQRLEGKGLAMVIPKPFDLDTLVTAVRGAIRAQARRKQRPTLDDRCGADTEGCV